MSVRFFLANLFLLAISLAWLVPFVSILLYGTHTVSEPNPVVLSLELTMFLSLISFASYNLVTGASTERKKKVKPDGFQRSGQL